MWVLKDMGSTYFGEWGFKRDERVTSHSEAIDSMGLQ